MPLAATRILGWLSLLAQGVFFLGFVFMMRDLLTFPPELVTPESDPDLVRHYIAETFASYRQSLGIGILGAVATWLIISRAELDDDAFLTTARVLAWLWLPFIPIGTLIGIVILGARRELLTGDQSED